MDTALIITVCLSGTVGAGCLLAGFCALLAHDDADLRRLQEKVTEARRVSRWAAYRTARREALPISVYCLPLADTSGRAALDLGWTDLRLVAVIAAQFT